MTKPPTKAERDARKAFRQVDARKAMTEHEIAQKAFSNNRERLKAERLAREAAEPPPPKTEADTQSSGSPDLKQTFLVRRRTDNDPA
jgi:hypothetical protein